MSTLICDCNQTMPLSAARLGAALNEKLTLHSSLCRREASRFVAELTAGEPLVVACTQESRLFAELAEQNQFTAPLRFVNIRETGGWSRDAAQAGPKIAALLALAHLPEPEPVSTVRYQSCGRLLIIGAMDAACAAADLLSDVLDITLFTLGVGAQDVPQERRFPVLGGHIQRLTGYLGAFELHWLPNNPIDLDLCTRCNACLSVCPSDAIGMDYQISLDACDNSRRCVRVCQVAGAIDFQRAVQPRSQAFDLILDLRADPAFTQHAPPLGYVQWNGRDLKPLLQLRDWVGEFEKAKFFDYRPKLCAHSRNDKIGCSACIDVCSASAISSEHKRQQIKVNPNLCVGCGTCSTVCPSGALSFTYPRAADQGLRLKTLLTTYTRNAGKNPVVLLHSQGAGARLLGDLGRAAQLEKAQKNGTHGVPARVLPLALWHTSSVGMELWLSAVAYGACQVWVLMSQEEAPQYRQAVLGQMAVAQAILTGLGYAGEHFRVLQARDARDLATLVDDLQAAPAEGVRQTASFVVQSDKRATLELALDHLVAHAPQLRALTPGDRTAIDLPASASPLGGLAISKDACTLCLSCVSACPNGALQDNAQTPQLKFIEKNCVQCGLCVKTCPEKALSLVPRLNLLPQRRVPVLLNEMQPYSCVRCAKPFGTLKGIEAMLGKLGGHSMFQGEALQRLKMCADCRVIDLYCASNETKISEI